MSIERRLQERFSMDLQAKISYRLTGDNEEISVETVAANISSGGAFLTTDKPIPLACKVKMEFLISIDDLKKLKFILSRDTLRHITNKNIWVESSGVVIRQDPDGVAIIFEQNYQLTPLKSKEKS